MRIEPTSITEIFGRADAGISVRPFRCLTKEGFHVYFKPFGSNPHSLIAEIIGSQIGLSLGIPIPDFGLAEASAAVVGTALKSDNSDIKPGFGFISYAASPGVHDLEFSELLLISEKSLAELYLFDRWIGNSDRILTKLGGNPNLLFDSTTNAHFAIDHDAAFEVDEGVSGAQESHVGFTAARNYWQSPTAQRDWVKRASVVFDELASFYDTIPPSWLDALEDGGNDPENVFADQSARLAAPFDEPQTFWNTMLS